MAALTATALWWLGLREWLFWGIVSGVLNTIPYFGPVIVSGALFVVGYLQFGALVPSFYVAGAAAVITSLEGWLLAPVLMGRAARMNPVAVFVGLLFWGLCLGGLGRHPGRADDDDAQGRVRPGRGSEAGRGAHRRITMRSLAIVCAVAFAGTMAAAQRFEFFPGGIYDSKVPTPESVLGYPIGSYHTSYAGLERWLDAIRGSDRVRIVRYGESVEKRPLYLIVISSPANIARLDAVRAATAKLADPRTSSDAEAETIATYDAGGRLDEPRERRQRVRRVRVGDPDQLSARRRHRRDDEARCSTAS